jgi:hypothetical protein
MRGLLLAIAIIAAGCGSDAGAPVDAAPDAIPYPAFGVPPLPVAKGPGPVMASVRVVPVFFANDPLHDQLLDYFTKYAASPYWAAQTGEYGVGAMTLGTPVELTDPSPASLSDDDIQTYLQTELDGTHPEWGATDTQTLSTTVYVLLYQDATTVTSTRNGTMCQTWIAYHWHVPDPGHGASIIYSVVPRCPIPQTSPFGSVLDEVTSATTHELVEAGTDPLLDAWTWYTEKTAGWGIALDGEVADLCEHQWHSLYTPPDLGYMIQRTWSNAAARADHDPCVPDVVGDGPYFNSIVPIPDVLTIPLGELYGIAVPVGGARTIPVELFSDGPTTGPWQLQAFPTDPAVQVSFDRNGGENGDSIQMTVQLTAAPAAGFAAVTIYNYLGNRDTVWPFIVAAKP